MEHKVAKIKVDDEGYVKCPECGERKRCGTAGVENILKNHQGTKTFMKPHPKPVPSTVTADPVAQGQAGSSKQESSAHIEDPELHDEPEQCSRSTFVRELRKISRVIERAVDVLQGQTVDLSEVWQPLTPRDSTEQDVHAVTHSDTLGRPPQAQRLSAR